MTKLESQVSRALTELADLLTAYHTLDSIRTKAQKPTRTYVVADIMAASLARHDIPRASARADALVREYLEAEGFFEDE